ncbi:MAG: DNA mismatch repair protein MutS, partial [Alphaproteobacteria bacterium]
VPAPPRPLNAPAKPTRTVAGATLDGGWDRKLRQGEVRPDRIIDLHGHTLAAAHDVLAHALDDAHANGDRVLLVITGKGRADRPSRIRGELAHWLDAGAMRSRIASLRAAHPRHGGGGAFYLILRRH